MAKYDPESEDGRPRDASIGMLTPEPLTSSNEKRLLPAFVWSELLQAAGDDAR